MRGTNVRRSRIAGLLALALGAVALLALTGVATAKDRGGDDHGDHGHHGRHHHHHFREMTGSSPLQFQKQLRLFEARRLMLTEGMDTASAAFATGYESATQFNREYRRQFGQPPRRDVTVLQGAEPLAFAG